MCSPSEDNIRYFNAMILGTSQSPYEDKLILSLYSIMCNRFWSKYALDMVLIRFNVASYFLVV